MLYSPRTKRHLEAILLSVKDNDSSKTKAKQTHTHTYTHRHIKKDFFKMMDAKTKWSFKATPFHILQHMHRSTNTYTCRHTHNHCFNARQVETCTAKDTWMVPRLFCECQRKRGAEGQSSWEWRLDDTAETEWTPPAATQVRSHVTASSETWAMVYDCTT